MATPNNSVQGPSEAVNINGLFLQHYLLAQRDVQATLNEMGEEGLTKFTRNVWFLRSIITDDEVYKRIEKAVEVEKKRIAGMKDPISENEQEYLLGFVTVHECMKFLDHTLQITKKQVKICADQSDPAMPRPPDRDESGV